ncbi:MAG: gliding motility protein GldN [Ferruginibacter sp.]
MKKYLIKYLMLALCLGVFSDVAMAQKGKKRTVVKRGTTKKTTTTKTKAKIQPSKSDTLAVVKPPMPAPANDSLPVPFVKPSLRPEDAVDMSSIKARTPLPYEHLRGDDAVFRHKIWREIDIREKINQPFGYKANENNGNQRFFSILLKAIQDSAVTVFSNIDDRFTTPMKKSEVARALGGDSIPVTIYDSANNPTTVMKLREINLDSVYKFHIKEEVIFDKESSRLFWRILGIAPVMNVINSAGVNMGESEIFWVYYPDMRPVFAKYEVYNGKNFGARMSWEELFESRMFYGRITKSTINNPNDLYIKNYPGLTNNPILQLLEGETIKETIFNYEQDLWSY